MTKTLVSMILALGALASPALAGETTVTLAVRNWYCAACPHVIRQSLAAVPGVINVASRIRPRQPLSPSTIQRPT